LRRRRFAASQEDNSMQKVEGRRANHRVTENTEKAQRRKKSKKKTEERVSFFCLSSFELFSSVFFSVFSVTLWLALLSSALLIAGAPAPSPPAPASPPTPPANTYHTPSESETFAVLMLEAVNWVSDIYVRPVSRVELLDTALTALYERARRPVPRDLRRRLERAERASAAQTESAASAPPPLVPALAPRRAPIADERPLLELLRSVRADLGRIEQLGGGDPLCIGCQAMLRSLDPYSGVITTKEDRRILSPGSEREGFGLEVPDDGERVVIRDVLLGSSAQQAGLRPGDEIVRLHDSDGRERDVKESLNVLNGRVPLLKPEQGAFALPQPITLTYRRPNVEHSLRECVPSRGATRPPDARGERRVTLEWRRFRPESVFGVSRRNDNSWNYWLDAERKIAYLRLGNLTGTEYDGGTPDELADILAALRRDGLRGLILDLRWCPGGALTGSTKTAELFLGEGTIATIRYRNQPEEVYRSTNEDKHNDFPMVVLINSESTGGAEMIAAALQDHHRAVLVGQRTHGKGNVQKLRGLATASIKVTSGTILRPCGKPLHRFPDSKPDDPWGVHPDPGHEFRISADASRALRTWWDELTMRPGSSTKRLPLDDPLADPQRNAALEALTVK
jgi:carboxyl-terminal processing protease